MKGRGKVRKDLCLYISYSTEAIFLCLWLYLVFLGIMAETRTRNDISAKYIQTLVDQPMTLESAEDLERVLMEPLPGTIFVHQGTFPAAENPATRRSEVRCQRRYLQTEHADLLWLRPSSDIRFRGNDGIRCGLSDD